MFYFEFSNKEERVFISTLKYYPNIDKVDLSLEENIQLEKEWYLYKKTSDYTIKVICTEQEAQNLSSTKRRALALNIFLSLAPLLKGIEVSQRQHFDTIVQRFIHNLVNVNKKLKGSLQSLASEKAKDSKNEKDFINEIKRRIENNTLNAATIVSKVSKRTTDLDSQITGLRLISGFSDGLKASFIDIDLRRVINRFILDSNDEFVKNKITIKLNIPSGIKVRIDYDLLKFAFSQFFDNNAKYVLPGSELSFTIYKDAKNDVTIKSEMTSLKIEDTETENIFFENTRGKEAQKFTDGKGLGMFMIRKALKLMGGAIYVECDNSKLISKNERDFGKNKFFIKLKKT